MKKLFLGLILFGCLLCRSCYKEKQAFALPGNWYLEYKNQIYLDNMFTVKNIKGKKFDLIYEAAGNTFEFKSVTFQRISSELKLLYKRKLLVKFYLIENHTLQVVNSMKIDFDSAQKHIKLFMPASKYVRLSDKEVDERLNE